MREGSQADSAGLFEAPKGGALDLAVVGEQGRELDIVERASDSTICRSKKNLLKPHRRQCCHPAEGQQRVRSRHEDVLRSIRGHAIAIVRCLPDETSKQLLAETRVRSR